MAKKKSGTAGEGALALIIVALVVGAWLKNSVTENPGTWIVAAIGIAVTGGVACWLIHDAHQGAEPPRADTLAAPPALAAEPPPTPAFRAGEIELARNVNVRLGIDYVDQNAEATRRVVAVRIVGGRTTRGRGTYMTALCGYCEMRKGMRTFRVTGIERAFDPVTGEIVDNLGQYLMGRTDIIAGEPPPPPSAARRKRT